MKKYRILRNLLSLSFHFFIFTFLYLWKALRNSKDNIMPVISRFFGIVIMMYWNDHNPPHLHAKYGGYEVIISIDGKIIDGTFPKRALKLVKEWIKIHKQELIDNWQRARNGELLQAIPPLE